MARQSTVGNGDTQEEQTQTVLHLHSSLHDSLAETGRHYGRDYRKPLLSTRKLNNTLSTLQCESFTHQRRTEYYNKEAGLKVSCVDMKRLICCMLLITQIDESEIKSITLANSQPQ